MRVQCNVTLEFGAGIDSESQQRRQSLCSFHDKSQLEVIIIKMVKHRRLDLIERDPARAWPSYKGDINSSFQATYTSGVEDVFKCIVMASTCERIVIAPR